MATEITSDDLVHAGAGTTLVLTQLSAVIPWLLPTLALIGAVSLGAAMDTEGRAVLLPSVLALLGRRTWALPRPLERRLPRIAIEAPPEPATG